MDAAKWREKHRATCGSGGPITTTGALLLEIKTERGRKPMDTWHPPLALGGRRKTHLSKHENGRISMALDLASAVEETPPRQNVRFGHWRRMILPVCLFCPPHVSYVLRRGRWAFFCGEKLSLRSFRAAAAAAAIAVAVAFIVSLFVSGFFSDVFIARLLSPDPQPKSLRRHGRRGATPAEGLPPGTIRQDSL